MSFERILVPLDGSKLAEASLPTASALARHLGSVLVFVHAVEHDPPDEVHGEPHLNSSATAEAYLEQQRLHCVAEGLRAEVHVVESGDGDIAQVIVELAERFETDLIAMCAHGRQSLRDRFLGPIAQRALRGGGPPIMLTTTNSSPERPLEIGHILLPVDFRHEMKTALANALTLATGFDASVTLLHAVDAGTTGLPARMLPNTSFELSKRAQADAQRRLDELASGLVREGVSVDTIVSTQDPDDAIIDEAQERHADIIILVSHGRSGVSAWYERSVGQRIIQEPELNLLLLREP